MKFYNFTIQVSIVSASAPTLVCGRISDKFEINRRHQLNVLNSTTCFERGLLLPTLYHPPPYITPHLISPPTLYHPPPYIGLCRRKRNNRLRFASYLVKPLNR